jgi:hypothetical protein
MSSLPSHLSIPSFSEEDTRKFSSFHNFFLAFFSRKNLLSRDPSPKKTTSKLCTGKKLRAISKKYLKRTLYQHECKYNLRISMSIAIGTQHYYFFWESLAALLCGPDNALETLFPLPPFPLLPFANIFCFVPFLTIYFCTFCIYFIL